MFSRQNAFHLDKLGWWPSLAAAKYEQGYSNFPPNPKEGLRICPLSRNRFPALIPANLRQRSKNRFGANKPRGYRESNNFCSYLPLCWFLPFLFPQHNPIGLQWKRLQPNPLGTDCFWRVFNIFLIQGNNLRKHSLRFQLISFCLHWWLLKKPFLYFQSGVCCWTT